MIDFTIITTGLFSRNANVDLSMCVIDHHKAGGIMIESHKKNKVQISGNQIALNDGLGIYVSGEDADPHIFGFIYNI